MGFNMKHLQQMQNKLIKMQEELQNTIFEGTSGGGAVTITMTGKFEVTGRQAHAGGGGPRRRLMLEDLILTACQDAFSKATDAQQKMMSALTGGMKLPPGLGF